MAKVINLSTVRKRKAKEEERRLADLNAVRHGLSRPDRKKADRTKAIEKSRLDGKRLHFSGDAESTSVSGLESSRPVVIEFRDRTERRFDESAVAQESDLSSSPADESNPSTPDED